jgi:indoleacetamide hydrolase
MQSMHSVRRREFLLLSAQAIAGTISVVLAKGAWAQAATSDLSALSLVAASGAVRNGDIKAEDYATALLGRYEANKHLNAFITIDSAQVMEAARAADKTRATGASLGMLHGMPIAVKDSINTKALPTTAGTNGLI